MKTNSLFRLIQALDKGEFRHCRNFLSKENSTPSQERLLVFDTLSNMSEHDEDELKNAVSGKSIATNLSVKKNRLYTSITHQIGLLSDSRKPNDDPEKKLREGKTFLKLGLLEEAAEAANKGIKSAIIVEELFLEVSLRELLRVIYKNMNNKKLTSAITENEYLLETASRKLATLIRYTQLNDRAFDYLRRYRVSDEQGAIKGMQEIMETPEMLDLKKADSLPAQLRYFNIRHCYYSSRNQLEKSIASNHEELKLWESNQARIKLYPLYYLSTLSNLLGKVTACGRIEEAPAYLKKMEEVQLQGRRSEILKFSTIELQYQLYYLNSGKLQEALGREEKILNGFRRYGKHISDATRLTFLYNLGVSHLISDNSGKALHFFNKIRDLGRLSQRADLQGVARLLRLLLLCENDPNGSFEHYLRNSQRFFKERDKVYDLEVVVYSWLNQHHRYTEQEKRVASFQKLADQMGPFMKKGRIGSEEMMIWSTAQARQVPVRQVYQERLNKQKT